MSHLVTIGISVGQGKQKKKRREINIPSVVKGKKVSQREAIDAFFFLRLRVGRLIIWLGMIIFSPYL